MAVAFLLLYMNALLPVRQGPAWQSEWTYRLELAQAIVAATERPLVRMLLARIARFESNYREDVGRCTIKGKANDLGPFQVVPRSHAERERLCVSLVGDARLAVERIEESVRACRRLPLRERLAVYARGRCASADGRRLSRVRWPSARSVALYRTAMEGDRKR